MIKKKKTVKKRTSKSLPFKPTGKMVVLIEMKDVDGPFELRVDDVDIVLDVMRAMIARMGNTLDVNSYTDEEEKILTEYVRGR
jgi:hypothetical protein